MPKFKYLLANGKHLVIDADTEPTDEQIEREAKTHGVVLALADNAEEAKPEAKSAPKVDADGDHDGDTGNMLTEGLNGIGGALRDVAKGGVKGLADAAVGAGEMVHKIPGVTAMVDKLYGMPGISDRAFAEAHHELAPQNGAERLGRVGADVATMALAPEQGSLGIATKLPKLVEAAGIPGLIAGAQTGGDPEAMGTAAALGGGGELAGQGLEALAGKIRGGQAAKVAAQRTAKAAKAQGDSMDDPFWMNARNVNTDKFAQMAKQYGITGAESDLAKIRSAPLRDQEVLSALSNMMNKKGSIGHEWSLWSTLAALGGLGTGGAGGLGVVAPAILGSALVKKYPGQAARMIDSAAQLMPQAGRAIAGLPGGLKVDPMTEALLNQENK